MNNHVYIWGIYWISKGGNILDGQLFCEEIAK